MSDQDIIDAYQAMFSVEYPWASAERLRQAAEFAAEMHDNPTEPTADELRVQARWLRQIIGPPPEGMSN